MFARSAEQSLKRRYSRSEIPERPRKDGHSTAFERILKEFETIAIEILSKTRKRNGRAQAGSEVGLKDVSVASVQAPHCQGLRHEA